MLRSCCCVQRCAAHAQNTEWFVGTETLTCHALSVTLVHTTCTYETAGAWEGSHRHVLRCAEACVLCHNVQSLSVGLCAKCAVCLARVQLSEVSGLCSQLSSVKAKAARASSQQAGWNPINNGSLTPAATAERSVNRLKAAAGAGVSFSLL